jgi:imidazolonepropionase-like amidohydrolase
VVTRTVFTGGVVYDGTSALPSAADVVVEGDHVLSVGTDQDGDEGVDCSGAFVAPGFFDCHVHVTLARPSLLDVVHTPFSLQFFIAAANLRATLDTGITYVRDAGGADLGVKEAVARGLIPGPRMQIAVNMLTQTGGHGDPWTASGTEVPLFVPHPGRPAAVVDGPDEVRRK